MNIYIRALIEGSIIFIGIFLFNIFCFVRKQKKLKKDDMPLELIYLSGIYGINPKKIKFRQFQYTYSIINAFIITTTYILVIYLLKNMLLRIIFGIGILILLIIICYGLLGRYYLKREIKLELKEKNLSKKK